MLPQPRNSLLVTKIMKTTQAPSQNVFFNEKIKTCQSLNNFFINLKIKCGKYSCIGENSLSHFYIYFGTAFLPETIISTNKTLELTFIASFLMTAKRVNASLSQETSKNVYALSIGKKCKII